MVGKNINLNDKDLAILALTIIAIASLLKLSDPSNIVLAVVSAIAGFVTGRETAKTEQGK